MNISCEKRIRLETLRMGFRIENFFGAKLNTINNFDVFERVKNLCSVFFFRFLSVDAIVSVRSGWVREGAKWRETSIWSEREKGKRQRKRKNVIVRNRLRRKWSAEEINLLVPWQKSIVSSTAVWRLRAHRIEWRGTIKWKQNAMSLRSLGVDSRRVWLTLAQLLETISKSTRRRTFCWLCTFSEYKSIRFSHKLRVIFRYRGPFAVSTSTESQAIHTLSSWSYIASRSLCSTSLCTIWYSFERKVIPVRGTLDNA